MMEWLLTLACIIGVWTVLNIVGIERERRVTAMEKQAQTAAKIEPEQPVAHGDVIEVTPVK
jgi:hypothetical protein